MKGLMQGNSLNLLKKIPKGKFDMIYVDPVWPNNSIKEFKGINPYAVFKKAAKHFPRIANRVAVHLGCDSDPRFLEAIPKSMPFLRVCYMRYAQPNYKGRILYDADVVYIFGKPPKSKKGHHLLGGGTHIVHTNSGESRYGHPCPRRLIHVQWIIDKFAEGPILDPFSGVGTTAEACINLGLQYLCIEIKEEYHAEACKRIKSRLLGGLQQRMDV
jgi:DNA modification methylase